jgi:two-component system sensor histidine kinase EvgS
MNPKIRWAALPRFAALLLAAWLPALASAEPPLRAGCEYDYEPFCLVRADGQADGFSVELLRETARTMGREITFKTAPWPELKKDLAEGRLDVLPLVARTPEREPLFDFTFPYLSSHGAIVVRKDNADITKKEDLKGKHVAVLEEDIAHEYLRTANLGALIEPLPSFARALQELSEGKHDAVVIQRLLAFQLMKSGNLTNLKVAGNLLADYSQKFCFAVRKGDKPTLELLNEGLSILIANDTFHHVHTRWFSPLEALDRPRDQIIVGGDYRYPPFEYSGDKGLASGFNSDLTREIAKQMGLAVDIRLGRWSEILAAVDRGEIDILQGLFYSPER